MSFRYKATNIAGYCIFKKLPNQKAVRNSSRTAFYFEIHG